MSSGLESAEEKGTEWIWAGAEACPLRGTKFWSWDRFGRTKSGCLGSCILILNRNDLLFVGEREQKMRLAIRPGKKLVKKRLGCTILSKLWV